MVNILPAARDAMMQLLDAFPLFLITFAALLHPAQLALGRLQRFLPVCDVRGGVEGRAIGENEKVAYSNVPADPVLIRLLDCRRLDIELSLDAGDPPTRTSAHCGIADLTHQRTTQANLDPAHLGKKDLRVHVPPRFIMGAKFKLDLLAVWVANRFSYALLFEARQARCTGSPAFKGATSIP